MKAKKAAVKKTIKKAEKKPVVKKAVKKPVPKKATIKKPVKKTDKPLARNEKLLWGIRKDKSDEHEVKIYKKIPKGWQVSEGTLTDPKGYKWIDNKKSLFEKDKNGKPVRKTAFIERDWHKKMTIAEKNDFHENHPITVINRSGKKVTYGAAKKAKVKAVYRKSTDKVGDVLVNQAGVKYKITGERYAPPSGYDDGKLKIRMLEITPEKKTGIKPFETNDVTLKYYRDKRFLTRVKR